MTDYNPKNALKMIRRIYAVLLIAPIAFFLLVMQMSIGNIEFTVIFNGPMEIPMLVLLLGIIPASIIVSRSLLGKIKEGDSLQSKLAKFQSLNLIRCALWIGLANFTIVVFMMEGNLVAIGVFTLAIIGIISHFPSLNKLEKEIKLTSTELHTLTN